MKKIIRTSLFILTIFFLFSFAGLANAEETSIDILGNLKETLRIHSKKPLRALNMAWVNLGFKKAGETVLNFLKEQWRYRKNVWKREWRKERKEIAGSWRGLKPKEKIRNLIRSLPLKYKKGNP